MDGVTVSVLGALVALAVAIVLILKKVQPTYAMIFGAVIGGLVGGAGLTGTVSFIISGTQGIVSALQRSNVKASNTSRAIDYIQHDASINNGNSGGGLFNYKGELVGINTLKYSGSAYTGATFEGLGFAIPVETVKDITSDLMQYGKVQRAQLGIKAFEYDNGPDEPMNNYAPMGVYVSETVEDGPAAKACRRTTTSTLWTACA